MGFSVDELIAILETLESHDEIAAFELNFSCPNVKTGNIVGSDPVESEAMMTQLRAHSTKPMIAKLAPSTSRPDLVALAAESAGADAISLINTLPGMAFAPGTERAVARRRQWRHLRTRQFVPSRSDKSPECPRAVRIPVIGMGGVENGARCAAICSTPAQHSLPSARKISAIPQQETALPPNLRELVAKFIPTEA